MNPSQMCFERYIFRQSYKADAQQYYIILLIDILPPHRCKTYVRDHIQQLTFRSQKYALPGTAKKRYRRIMPLYTVFNDHLMKLVNAFFAASGSFTPAFLPASMHCRSHAIFFPSTCIICNPSSSRMTSFGRKPWTIGQ